MKLIVAEWNCLDVELTDCKQLDEWKLGLLTLIITMKQQRWKPKDISVIDPISAALMMQSLEREMIPRATAAIAQMFYAIKLSCLYLIAGSRFL